MDLFSKLSDYEIFGHLTQGLLLFAAIDIAFGSSLILGADWTVSTGVAVVLTAYLTGHLIASPSSLVLERGVARGLLGAPMGHLMGIDGPSLWQQFLFPGYFNPLPPSSRERLLSSLKLEHGSRVHSDDLFWLVYPSARSSANAQQRLATFLRLYGFCRNSAFVALVAAVMFIVGGLAGHPLGKQLVVDRSVAVAIALAAAWLLFLRYLKFYRSYSLELVTAHLSSLNPSPDRADKAGA